MVIRSFCGLRLPTCSSPLLAFRLLSPFAGMDSLETAFGNLSVIWHAPPTFGMRVPEAADVNRVAVIGVVQIEFLSAIPHTFLITHIGHRQRGNQAGMDSSTPPAPREVADFQFDGFRRPSIVISSSPATAPVAASLYLKHTCQLHSL